MTGRGRHGVIRRMRVSVNQRVTVAKRMGEGRGGEGGRGGVRLKLLPVMRAEGNGRLRGM